MIDGIFQFQVFFFFFFFFFFFLRLTSNFKTNFTFFNLNMKIQIIQNDSFKILWPNIFKYLLICPKL